MPDNHVQTSPEPTDRDASGPEHVLVTYGSGEQQTAPWTDVRTLIWPELGTLLTQHRIGDKTGTCIVPATFRGTKRRAADAERIEIVMLDSDAGATLEEIAAAIEARGWAAIVSSTHSHLSTRTRSKRGTYENWLAKTYPDGPDDDAVETFLVEDKGMMARVAAGATVADQGEVYFSFEHAPCPKFRITLRLERPWVASSYDSQKQANDAWGDCIKAVAAALDLRHDESCSDTSRLFYMPRRPADGPPAETKIIEGAACDIFALPKVKPPEPSRLRKFGWSNRF